VGSVKMKVYASVIDVRQASDPVHRDTRWALLEVYGARGKLLEAITLLYRCIIYNQDTTEAVVRVGGPSTDKTHLLRGRQTGMCSISYAIIAHLWACDEASSQQT
jgi:hypothetical protein